jgi:hypothetical protein
MIDLRLLNLQEGDSQADVANKLNYNFNQIINAGDGAYGPVGIPGAVGSYGATGITGPAGFQGQRGNFWFVQETGPTAGVTGGDYWIDLANDCEVFEWVKSDGPYSWVSQGFLLSQSGVFEIAASTTGLTSGYPTQAYVIALPSPAEKTLVLSGASGPNVKNPQLSRVMIETGGTTGFPLLEFSKYGYQSNSAFNSLTPKMKWYTTNTASPDVYGLTLEAKGGIGFNVANFNGVAYNEVRFTTGSIGSGITGAFSNDLNYYAATGDFIISSTALSINSVNAVWNNVGFTGPVSFSATTGVDTINSGRNTLMVENGITYNRVNSYITGQNLLSVKYSGSSSYSEYGPYLASPNNFYLADSDGNNKFAKKTSGYFPNPKTVSGFNNTGTYTWTGKITGTQDVYSVGAATSTTSNVNLMRHQIGEFFHPDILTDGEVAKQALAVFIPNSAASSKTGYGYLVSAGESMTFRVNTTSSGCGFNAIILDAPDSNNPTTTLLPLSSGAKKNAVLLGDLVTGGNENTYADQFEFTIVRVNSLNEWKVYFKAWGGNLKNYTTNDSAIVCGCVSTTS